MARPALLTDQIESFRERSCDAALELFSERGYDGFTLRALGEALGCSPAKPYRYFRDKTEIFNVACGRAFDHFCEFLEERLADVQADSDPWERIAVLGRAYAEFARTHPHAYRVMFHLIPPGGVQTSTKQSVLEEMDESLHASVMRSWEVLLEAFEVAVEAGALRGETASAAHGYWASLHGAMALELAGRFFLGTDGESVVDEVIERFERAYRNPE
jgi:AcrR family transcriptional regulator